jgi:hypothetical protein
VSRGPGTWQRQILHTTSGTVVATVSGIVRTTMVAPDRSDYTAARRGTKQLALAERVAALYVWGCTRCMRIQDSETPQPCCGPVRPLLAVCQPERRRLLAHPAPPPGGVAPSWISVAVPPRPLGQLPAVGIADLASLALRRAYERLEVGVPGVSVQDVVAVSRLAWQVERDEAVPARDKALAELAEAQAAVLSLKDAIIRRSGLAEWRELWGEVRKERERAQEIRKTRERFATVARPVHRPQRPGKWDLTLSLVHVRFISAPE